MIALGKQISPNSIILADRRGACQPIRLMRVDPIFLPQNMPGAGGRVAASWLCLCLPAR